MDPEWRGRRAHRAGGSAQQRSPGSRVRGWAQWVRDLPNYLDHVTRQRRPPESARPGDSARRDVSVYAPPLHPPALSGVLTAQARLKPPRPGKSEDPKDLRAGQLRMAGTPAMLLSPWIPVSSNEH